MHKPAAMQWVAFGYAMAVPAWRNRYPLWGVGAGYNLIKPFQIFLPKLRAPAVGDSHHSHDPITGYLAMSPTELGGGTLDQQTGCTVVWLLGPLGCPRIDSLGREGSGVILITGIVLGAFWGLGKDTPSQPLGLAKDLAQGDLQRPDLGLSQP